MLIEYAKVETPSLESKSISPLAKGSVLGKKNKHSNSWELHILHCTSCFFCCCCNKSELLQSRIFPELSASPLTVLMVYYKQINSQQKFLNSTILKKKRKSAIKHDTLSTTDLKTRCFLLAILEEFICCKRSRHARVNYASSDQKQKELQFLA